jgi:hypothetical protein
MRFLPILVAILVRTPMVMADEPTPRRAACDLNPHKDPCLTAAVAVPEPGVGWLLPASGLMLLQRKRRRAD